MTYSRIATLAACLAAMVSAPAVAQVSGEQPRQVQLIDTLTLPELQAFLESAEYRVLAAVEETNTLRIQGGDDPAFYVELEQCNRAPGNRCAAITVMFPDAELAGVSEAILLDANRGFAGIKTVAHGPEKTVFYRRYIRLEGGVTPAHLLRQLVIFEVQYKNVAQHLRERISAN